MTRMTTGPRDLARQRGARADRGVRGARDDATAGPVPAEERIAVVRQRRHAVVREADADRARLHPAPVRRDGRGRPGPARRASRGRPPTSRTTLARRRSSPSTTTATTPTCRCCWRHRWPAFAGISVEDFEAAADAFLRSGKHPTLGRGFLDCGYAPMVELLAYLEANGFSNYIASGGDRDFMRPITEEVYGIPRRAGDRQHERLATSRTSRRDDHARRRAGLLRRRTGEADPDLEPHRAPAAARGRQLQRRHPDAAIHRRHRDARAAPAGPARRRRARVRLHRRGRAVARAAAGEGWTVVSIKNDWTTVF